MQGQNQSAEREPADQILIVDDNDINRKLLGIYLRSLGHEFISSNNGYEALRKLESERIVLMFLDLHMPLIDGCQTTKIIRASDQPYHDIPIIGLSADGLSESLQKALQAGMNEFLVKPIKQNDVQQILHKWLPQQVERTHSNVKTLLNQKRLAELRTMLMNELPRQRQQLVDAWTQQDFQTIYDIAHKIAGGSAYCALPSLEESAADLQLAAKKANADTIKTKTQQLVKAINHVLHNSPMLAEKV